MRQIAIAITLIFAAAVSGCGTIMDATYDGPRIYGGIRWDCEPEDKAHSTRVVFRILDLPFSLIFDTLMLPVSLIRALVLSGSPTSGQKR